MLFDAATRRPAPRKARRQPGERLADALIDLADGKARIARHQERSWASITFAGTRNVLEMVFDGAEAVEAAESFIAYLPEHEFAIPGHLVADAAVTEVDHRAAPPRIALVCEILVLEDG